MSIQEPTPIVPPQEPLKGRDPTLAARTMGETLVTPTGDTVHRTVLPSPLVGFFDSTRLASVTFHGPVTIHEEHAANLRQVLGNLFQSPDGEYDVTFDGGPTAGTVTVSSRTSVALNVGAEHEDVDLAHLYTLLERLKQTSDVIEATASENEPRIREALVDAGFTSPNDAALYGVEHGRVTHVAVPTAFVWRRGR